MIRGEREKVITIKLFCMNGEGQNAGQVGAKLLGVRAEKIT